jgi:ADP-ribose pyrophosphatase
LQSVKHLAQNVIHQEVRQGECRWVLAQETFQLITEVDDSANSAIGAEQIVRDPQDSDSQNNNQQNCSAVSHAPISRTLLRHPGVAAIVPITLAGEIILISQYRYTVGRVLWEIPAGTLHGEWQPMTKDPIATDPAIKHQVTNHNQRRMVAVETPLQAAQRELQEEAGLQAGCWEFIQQFYVMPGTSDGLIYLFAAFDLTPVKAQPDEGELITQIAAIELAMAERMVIAGEICDAKTMIAIQWAKAYYQQGGN